MEQYNYPVAAQATNGLLEVPRYTLTQRLTQEKANLQTRLDEINAVLDALAANPQVQSVLDLLQKTRCL